MVLTPSNMMPLGTQAPDFSLLDVTSNESRALSDVKGEKGTVVMFICAHCPFVIHVQDELARLANDYLSKEIGFVAISANDVDNYPEDSPENLLAQAKKVGFNFPYLFDETQEVAQAYDAACTPDFFVFDSNSKLVYRGQLDETRPNQGVAHGGDMRTALDNLLSGNPPLANQKPSVGCNIKWK